MKERKNITLDNRSTLYQEKMNHFEPETLKAVFRRLGIDDELSYEDKLREARRILGNLMRPERANGAQVHRSKKAHTSSLSSSHSRKRNASKSSHASSSSKKKNATTGRRRHTPAYERDASKRRNKKYSPVSRKRILKKMAQVSKSATNSSLSSTKSSQSSKGKTTVAKLPSKFNQKSFVDAAQRLASQGFTQVVSALQNNKDGKNKIWLMLRKPGSVKTGGRVTLWGNSEQPNRHTYGGSIENDNDLISSKLKTGYVKNAALKRMAANVLRKTQNTKKQ